MRIENRKAHFDYEILEKIDAGIILTGAEVKSIKSGAASLTGSRCVFNDRGQLVVIGMQVNPYPFANDPNYDPLRSRQLLLKQKELLDLRTKLMAKGLTLIPLACYTTHGLVKIEIALARGKKQYEKREVEKKRSIERGVQKLLKNKIT